MNELVNVVGDPRQRDEWDDVRYECLSCGDEHHPDDREDHAFLIGKRVCPECGGGRARVTHNLDGPVPSEAGQ